MKNILSLVKLFRFAIVGLVLIAALSVGLKASPRPNVLYLFTDDQRFDTIHALGNEGIRTPNIDRLVKGGVSFTNAYIMGGNSSTLAIASYYGLFV